MLALAVLTFVAVGALQLAMAFAAQRIWYPHESIVDVIQRPTVALIAQFLIYIPVAALMVVLVKVKDQGPFWRAIRWNWPSHRWPVLVGIGFLTMISLQGLERVLPLPKNSPFDQFFNRPLDAYAFAFLAIAFAPFMEELFFRGFLYPVLARRWGVGASILVTSAAFASIHGRSPGDDAKSPCHWQEG